MVVIEHAVQGLHQLVVLGLHPGAGQGGQRLRGSRCPAIIALIMSCADTVVSLLTTDETLTSALYSSFSSRCQRRVRSWVSRARARV